MEDEEMTEIMVEKYKQKLRESFPLSAPYKIDRLEFAHSYIKVIREWATENLGVKPFEEEKKFDFE